MQSIKDLFCPLPLEVNDPFIVDFPGNVFPAPRPIQASKRVVFDPLALPTDVHQCVFVEEHEEELSEVTQVNRVRCVASARIVDGGGYHCFAHGNRVFPKRKIRIDFDGDTVKSILFVDARAIVEGAREKVRLTTKGTFITYLC